MKKALIFTSAAVIAATASITAVNSQQNEMSFFITSVGSGNGADLGGLAAADAHCQQLAEAAGSRGKTWRAYLSAHADAALLPSMRATVSVSAPGTTSMVCRSPRISTISTAPTTT